jgi:chloramphenicol-sensitive protein RarD
VDKLSQPAASKVAPRAREANPSREGLAYGIGAYTAWGVIPLYFRALSHVSPWVVVCHRIIWSVLLLTVVISLRREWGLIYPVLRSRRNLMLLCAGAVLIAMNWLIFIYAVSTRQVLQASLGYFINPLFSVALGMIFLRERLRGWQWLAVMIAILAVANLVWRDHGLPWIAVSLAVSFGLYGLVRKKVNINSLHGLAIESALLFPLALTVIGLKGERGNSAATWLLLSLSGVVTTIPLLMFGAAIRRLQLSTVGFLQYIGPTLQFLVALVFFQEPLEEGKLLSFALCWLGIVVYVADSIFYRRTLTVADEPD